jgi:hypothetical protein
MAGEWTSGMSEDGHESLTFERWHALYKGHYEFIQLDGTLSEIMCDHMRSNLLFQSPKLASLRAERIRLLSASSSLRILGVT